MKNQKLDASGTLLRELVNKDVPFRFMGIDLRFNLSHALFSSFNIDSGSKLLLKTIAQHVDLAGVRSVLDLGCGTGVLAVSLKAKLPEARVTAADRDALALAFTTQNAALNGIKVGEESGFEAVSGLGLRGLGEREFDLIVSNLPAKAGNAVLSSVLAGLTRFLRPEGVLAFVIVKTLEDLAAQAIADAGYNIDYRESTPEHCVFHARKTRMNEPDLSLAPYLRGKTPLRVGNKALRFQTVFGLPEFDTLSFGTRLLVKLLAREPVAGRILVWNPGQGFLPVLLLADARDDLSLTLAGRDRLSLEIARANCLAAGAVEDRVAMAHVPSLHALTPLFDHLVVIPDSDAGVSWYRFFLPAILPLLKPGGLCFSAAKSSFFGRIDFDGGAVRILRDSRSKGFRGVVFRKQ